MNPKHTNIHEANTQLSRLLERLEAGEEVVISRAGKPVARLVPFEPPVLPRRLGLFAGQIGIGPGFDELPDGMFDA